MLRHVDGPPGRHRRASVRDAEDLHGLPLWSPLAVTVQHGGVHPLPRRICCQENKSGPDGFSVRLMTLRVNACVFLTHREVLAVRACLHV